MGRHKKQNPPIEEENFDILGTSHRVQINFNCGITERLPSENPLNTPQFDPINWNNIKEFFVKKDGKFIGIPVLKKEKRRIFHGYRMTIRPAIVCPYCGSILGANKGARHYADGAYIRLRKCKSCLRYYGVD